VDTRTGAILPLEVHVGKKKTRRKFSDEYKAETVKLIRDSNETIGSICKDLGLSSTAVRRWVKQAEIDEGKGPAGAVTTDELDELRRLRKENRGLRQEREILVKAAVFFAKESQ
jgi:transposase